MRLLPKNFQIRLLASTIALSVVSYALRHLPKRVLLIDLTFYTDFGHVALERFNRGPDGTALTKKGN